MLLLVILCGESTEVAHGSQNQILLDVHLGVRLYTIKNQTVLDYGLFGNHFNAEPGGGSMPVLYHNPRCSKSRQAAQLCAESPLDVDIHLYLLQPLDYETLHSMLSRLDGDIAQAVRWKDTGLKLIDTTNVDRGNVESIAQFLAEHGQYMERPWLDDGKVTVIGRPVERLNRLL